MILNESQFRFPTKKINVKIKNCALNLLSDAHKIFSFARKTGPNFIFTILCNA